MLTESLLLYGQPVPPAELVPLQAGPLALVYDPTNGMIRRIRLGDREVLRGIYAAVRDRNWDTVPVALQEQSRAVGPDSFDLQFGAEHHQGDISFAWRGRIQGGKEGTLRYELEGEARTTFLRNRIGFCVLHPIRECAGAPARQTRLDGTVLECRFPEIIEPQIFGQSSFQNLRALAHEIAPGLWAEVTFEGEVFETEDQRNWTDASFKTYCPPLAVPFPVEISAGTRIRQCITLRLTGGRPDGGEMEAHVTSHPRTEVTLTTPAGRPRPLPRLGLGVASHGEPLSGEQVGRLRSLALSHLRVDVRLAVPGWTASWERAVREAHELGVGIELALHLPCTDLIDVATWRRQLRQPAFPVPLVRVLALRAKEAATSPETLAIVRQTVADWEVPVGAGSDANFCELNREHALGRSATEADFLFWSVNPQVHAEDAWTVMENLEAQTATAKSARVMAGAKPLVISPVTLRPRFNPVATGPEAAIPSGQLPRQVDPRQAGLFGAAWTLGSFTALATAGVEAVTFYETTGWRGVMETEAGSPVTGKFPSISGVVFPLYHVLADLGAFAGGEVVPVQCGDPRRVAALALRKGPQRALLVANLSPQPCHVDLTAFADYRHFRLMDATSVFQATTCPAAFRSILTTQDAPFINLPPYGIAHLANGA